MGSSQRLSAVSALRVRYCPADRVFLSGRGFPALFRRHGPIFPADRSRCVWWDSPTGLGIAVPARASQPNGGTRASKQISSAVVTRCEGRECGETDGKGGTLIRSGVVAARADGRDAPPVAGAPALEWICRTPRGVGGSPQN